jgi:23S rRNA pseudouridine2605 synthase
MRRKNFSSGKSESKERGGANGEKPRRRMPSDRKTSGEKASGGGEDKKRRLGRGGHKRKTALSEEGFERKNSTSRGRKTGEESPSFNGARKRTNSRDLHRRSDSEKYNHNLRAKRVDWQETGGERSKHEYKSGGDRFSRGRNNRFDRPTFEGRRKSPEADRNKPNSEETGKYSRKATGYRYSDNKRPNNDNRAKTKREKSAGKGRSSDTKRGFTGAGRGEDLADGKSWSGENKYRKPLGDNFRKGLRTTLKKTERKEMDLGDGIRLNKYIANSGISSRRDADKFIKTGVVTVNGRVITEMGHRVTEGDIVKFGDRTIKPEKPVYVVLNKPKDFITTTDDPRGRNIVTNLIKVKERIFPVGRLDRNTTGVLILTNDGDLGERLMHPRFNITKIYLVVLDKNLKPEHVQQLKEGVELEDGIIAFDDVAYVADDKKTIGVQIHSGRNRIIHRTFEQLGYKVDKLDRTSYAGITKKDLKRGDWRYLTPLELIELKKLTKLKGKY